MHARSHNPIPQQTMELFVILFLYLTAVANAEGSPIIYNVMAYGAKGDGNTDDTNAFLNAWKAACADTRNPYVVVSSKGGKNYMLSKIIFEGPCRSKLRFLISGGLVAPNRVWTNQIDTWIVFKNVPGLEVLGSGLIDGKGSIWWDCLSKHRCNNAPYIMEFMGCHYLRVMNLRLKDSPGKHLVVYKSDYVILSGVIITSPENSPNTDGILISDSQHGIITHSNIGVGDDCIAIGPRSYDINVSYITCGPGHGISIGSLGKNGVEDNVERIHISNSYIFNTLTGVRIKTWQGNNLKLGGAGHAKFITYENINFTSVKAGVIVIDQYYCPYQNCPNKTGNVAISGVSYYGLQGSSASDVAIRLACSSSIPCHDITMSQVSFTPQQSKIPLQSYCINAQGTESGLVSPHTQCLKHKLNI
ncbi:probable polygalacturonase At1g80170 [Phalaenopsis equestris]|uniref:probable polygalacturonase At1g80170 n=1 Tax=Phalaenopsis equestris TaxID=78828 RepID=UPI0009E46A38|nr:probable polygalacturonase At1g80170 [Phalaenopsis equestris]